MATTRPRLHVLRQRAIVGATAGAAALVAVFAAAPTAGAAEPDHSGSQHAVFVQTNDATGNAVIAYSQGNDGLLTKVGQYPTGGLGGAQAGAVVDPLASQGSVTFDQRHDLLFVVNAGSDTFSVFKADGAHLRRLQVLNSAGHLPTSVSVAGDLVYVLDAGLDGAISGYRIDDGHLRPIEGSTRTLGLANPANPNFLASPSQVAVTPNHHEVVVATKTHGVLDAFTLTRSGVPSATPVTTASAGAVPFALSFDRIGRLLVGEASGGVSSYWVQVDAELTTISSHVVNAQTATCWSAVAKGYLYVANAGSNSITGYSEDWRGQLTLLDSSGVTATTDAGPVDLATSADGQFLYQEATAAGVIDEFKVNDNGSLTKIGTVTGFAPDNGTGFEGIAAS